MMISGGPSLTPEEQSLKSFWTALQVAEKQHEKRGLQFGQAMCGYLNQRRITKHGQRRK